MSRETKIQKSGKALRAAVEHRLTKTVEGPHVVLRGNIPHGFECIGPFASNLIAQEWADDNECDGMASWVQPVILPEVAAKRTGTNMPGKIPSRFHTDDFVFDLEFNALPWFETASIVDLELLMREGWSCGPKSDEVAQACRVHEPKLGQAYEYLNLIHDAPSKKDCCGSSCVIDGAAAMAWLRLRRNAYWKILRDREMGER